MPGHLWPSPIPLAGIHGVAAVCAALLGRANPGKGQHIDMVLYNCMISTHISPVQRYTFGGTDISVQTGHGQVESTAYGVFAAVDGHLVIAAQKDVTCIRLARPVAGNDLLADARFLDPASRHSSRLNALALVRGRASAQPSRAACIAALDAAYVPCATMARIDEVKILTRDGGLSAGLVMAVVP